MGEGRVPVVICAGLLSADLLFTLPAMPPEGSKSRADGSRMIAGGGALNAAAAVAALGGHAILAGSVGDDEFGHFLSEQIAALGIEGALVETHPHVPTARSAVLMTAGGERTVINHRDARLFSRGLAHLPDAFDAALADTRWPAGALGLVGAARRAGRPAVLDVEAPVGHAEDALAGATHLAFSEQGLADLSGAATAAALENTARRFGTWACVTRGARNLLWSEGRGVGEIAAFEATAVDTLGAGDVWHGAFALGLAQGHDAGVSARRANAAASIKVARVAGSALPTAADVDAVVAARDRRGETGP